MVGAHGHQCFTTGNARDSLNFEAVLPAVEQGSARARIIRLKFLERFQIVSVNSCGFLDLNGVNHWKQNDRSIVILRLKLT